MDIVVGSAIMEKSDGSCEEMLHTATPSGIIYNASEFIEKSIRAYQWYAPACFNMYRRDFLLQNDFFLRLASTLKICKCYHEFFSCSENCLYRWCFLSLCCSGQLYYDIEKGYKETK